MVGCSQLYGRNIQPDAPQRGRWTLAVPGRGVPYLAMAFSAACSGAAPALLTLPLARMSTGDAGLP